MLKKINETVDFIKKKVSFEPEIGVVLGTGLGFIGGEIEDAISLAYEDIPNFPVSTVEGHQGKLIFGNYGGKKVVAMQGRFHYYEGYSMKELTFPIRVMKFLGIDHLILSNAAGGMNPDFNIGDVMIITDHINIMGDNPLLGPNDERLGPRFPDMSEVYNRELIMKAKKIARINNIPYQTGVYAAVSGPTYETPAEYHYIRVIGADAVGMSTVPEATVARQMGMKTFALSVITDLGVAGKIVEITHEEVLEAAALAESKIRTLIESLISQIEC